MHEDLVYFKIFVNIADFFLYDSLGPNCPDTSRPNFVDTLRSTCADSSCNQYIQWDILARKIMHEDLV